MFCLRSRLAQSKFAPSRPLSTSSLRLNTPPRPASTTSIPSLGEPLSPPSELDSAPLPPSPPPPPAREPEPEPAPIARVRRPVGAFRGGLIGFLLGTTLVGGYGYFQLLDDYTQASSLLLLSVEELKVSTEKMSSHIQRIERVETEVDKLVKNSSTKQDLEALRTEYKKLLEAEHLDALDSRAHIWGLEQDLHALSKKAATSVRI